MDKLEYISCTVGRIEGEMVQLRRLYERVARLEQCQAWLKGGLVALMGAFAFFIRIVFNR